MPATKPRMRAAPGWTKPAAGVMTTRPATTPEPKPRADGLPEWIHSAIIQERPAAAGAMVVVVKARPARPPAASEQLAPTMAEPALKPNQPNQRRPTPIRVKGRLWGAIRSVGKPCRLPRKISAARAEIPEER